MGKWVLSAEPIKRLERFDIRLKIIEWNINQQSNIPDEIPQFIEKIINKKNPHIAVLTEFKVPKKQEKLDEFTNSLDKYDYNVFYNSESKMVFNEVLIAIKKDIHVIQTVDKIPNCEDINKHPNFLRVDVEVGDKPLTIIGTRIAVGTEEEEKQALKKNQFSLLDNYLYQLETENVICIGDFNAYWGSKWKTKENTSLPKTSSRYKLFTPNRDIENNIFSFVNSKVEPEDQGKPYYKQYQTLDHLICKGLENVQVSYDWGFLKEPDYKNVCPKCVKDGFRGLPDHAILVADFTLP